MLDTTNIMLFELLIQLAKELVHNLQASKFGTEATYSFMAKALHVVCAHHYWSMRRPIVMHGGDHYCSAPLRSTALLAEQ